MKTEITNKIFVFELKFFKYLLIKAFYLCNQKVKKNLSKICFNFETKKSKKVIAKRIFWKLKFFKINFFKRNFFLFEKICGFSDMYMYNFPSKL